MFAFDPPAISQAAPASDQQDVIEVVGTRSDQALKIDRRTYQVQQTPHSQQKDTFQLLRGLPAVTISADDQINLLGSGNVKILIDGHDTRTDLHTFHGSDIDRIEIITNPSAQYSAEGTGGIINIVLRKKQGAGLSGNASIELNSLEKASGDVSLKLKKGKWTYELEGKGEAGTNWRSTYHKVRMVEASPGDAPTVNTEDGGGPSRRNDGSIRAKVTYDLDPRTSLSADAQADETRGTGTNRVDFRAVTPDFQPFSQVQRSLYKTSELTGGLALDHKGKKQGETLKASIWTLSIPNSLDARSAVLNNGDAFSSEIREGLFLADSKIDWEHPIGKKQILSIGADWSLQVLRHHYRFVSSDNLSLGGDAADEFRGRQSTVSAYTTFQQQIGTWTVMPGVRMESNMRHVSSPGTVPVHVRRTSLFPTLHIKHPISKALDLTLSYAKRIGRAQFDALRPFSVVRDVLTINQGNPSLRDQSTDAYEANLHYHRGKVDAGLIVYDRETSGLWSTSFTVNSAGQNVYMLINAGHRTDRGAEFDVSTPVIARIKLMTSINLFDSKVPVDATSSAATEHTFRVTGNSTLEWDGPDRGKTPGDIAQLQYQYSSPLTQFQFREFALHWLTLSYTHSFSRSLSLTATVDSAPLNNRHRLFAPLVQEYYVQHSRAQFKIKLMKTFGNPK